MAHDPNDSVRGKENLLGEALHSKVATEADTSVELGKAAAPLARAEDGHDAQPDSHHFTRALDRLIKEGDEVVSSDRIARLQQLAEEELKRDQRLKLDIAAQQHLSGTQRDMSMVRSSHLAANPAITKLPRDFEYSDEVSESHTTGRLFGGKRRIGSGEGSVSVKRGKWPNEDRWHYSGSRVKGGDEEKLSGKEAKTLYSKMIDPVAVEAFRAMESDISEVLGRIEKIEKDNALSRQEEVAAHQREIEEAFAEGVVKGERRAEVWSELADRADALDVELSKEDRDLIVEIIDVVAELKSNTKIDSLPDPKIPDSASRTSSALVSAPLEKDRRRNTSLNINSPQFRRQEDLLFNLLGADKKEGLQWVDGWWGQEEITDTVYETIFPDVVIVKDAKSGACRVERNTQRTAKQPKTSRSSRG